MLILLLILLAIVVTASMLHFDGAVHAVSPRLAEGIQGSGAWYVHPQLVMTDADPYAIYIVAPAVPRGDRFDAVRIDTTAGAQRETRIPLGPSSPYKPFVPAGVVSLHVRGLRLQRPALHLMTFPDGRGPGVHRVDSATGEIIIVLEQNGQQRPILTRRAFNSSSAAELLSLVWADPSGRWIVALSRTSGGWMLFLFPRNVERDSARHYSSLRLEEL